MDVRSGHSAPGAENLSQVLPIHPLRLSARGRCRHFRWVRIHSRARWNRATGRLPTWIIVVSFGRLVIQIGLNKHLLVGEKGEFVADAQIVRARRQVNLKASSSLSSLGSPEASSLMTINPVGEVSFVSDHSHDVVSVATGGGKVTGENWL